MELILQTGGAGLWGGGVLREGRIGTVSLRRASQADQSVMATVVV